LEKNQAKRAKRKEAREKGLCGICCIRPTAPDRKTCAHCLKKHRRNARSYREKHWDHVLHINYSWKRKNKDRVAAIARRCYAKLRTRIFDHYGPCVCCGEKRTEFLTIDHIENNGGLWRKANPKHANGNRFYLWIIRNGYPEDLQSLCWNCNQAKQIYGFCPHQKEATCQST